MLRQRKVPRNPRDAAGVVRVGAVVGERALVRAPLRGVGGILDEGPDVDDFRGRWKEGAGAEGGVDLIGRSVELESGPGAGAGDAREDGAEPDGRAGVFAPRCGEVLQV